MHGQGIQARRGAPNLHALGAAVRESRARRGLSQEGLGFAAGLHRNYIGALERGEVNATFRTLHRLTIGLRISLSDLIVIYERHLGERTWKLVGTAT